MEESQVSIISPEVWKLLQQKQELEISQGKASDTIYAQRIMWILSYLQSLKNVPPCTLSVEVKGALTK